MGRLAGTGFDRFGIRARFAWIVSGVLLIAFVGWAQPSAAGPYIQVAKTGNGIGNVAADAGDIDCGKECFSNYPVGSVVTLTAAADAGSVFVGWGGACVGARTCVVRISGYHTVYAAFLRDEPRLSIASIGRGSGRVTSTDGQIDCMGASSSSTCVSTYKPGTKVTFKAYEDPGSVFVGWGGDGSADCLTSGENICTVTMDLARTVTATFVAGCQQTALDCGPNPPPLVDFARPSDGTFLAAAGITAADAMIVSSAKAVLPETGRVVWCARVMQTYQRGGEQVCLDQAGAIREVREDLAREQDAVYKRRGNLTAPLFAQAINGKASDILAIALWIHAPSLSEYPFEPDCGGGAPCPREQERIKELTWRLEAVVQRLFKAGADVQFYDPALPMIRARIAAADLVRINFDPMINLVDLSREMVPSASRMEVLQCRMGVDAIRSVSPPVEGAGVGIGIHEFSQPDDASNLVLDATYSYDPRGLPGDAQHARRVAYVVRDTKAVDKEGFAPSASISLAASQFPDTTIPWLLSRGADLLLFASTDPYNAESVGYRGATSLLLDYLPMVAHRPLVVVPAGNGRSGGQPWCGVVAHPLYNGAVVGGVTEVGPSLCSQTALAGPEAASEKNPWSVFQNHWELPSILAPYRDLTLYQDGYFEGTSFSAAMVAGVAAGTAEGYRRANGNARLAPEALRAILMAAQPTTVNHSSHDCDDEKHTMAQLLDATAAYKIASGSRIPVNHVAPTAMGYDGLGVAAGSFESCRQLGTLPQSRQFACDHVAGSWRLYSPGVRPGVQHTILRVAIAWSRPVTCKILVQCVPNPSNPASCMSPFAYLCSTPMGALNLGIEVDSPEDWYSRRRNNCCSSRLPPY